MFPKTRVRRRKLPTRMTTRRGSGARNGLPKSAGERSTAGEDLRQFLRRHNFELRISAVGGLLVDAPSTKLGGVTKSGGLQVVVRGLHYQFDSQRLARKIFSLAPAALASGHAMPKFRACGCMFRPAPPGMSGK